MSRPLGCLTLALTNRCPLSCRHCGPRSGPGRRGELDPEVARAALRAAARTRCRMVNFSGGEPFTVAPVLASLVGFARRLGLRTRVTTGAAWSPDPDRALAHLEPVARAGLDQLYISVSDPHLEAVPLTHALAATGAARDLGVDVTLVAGVARGSRTTAAWLREAFLARGLTPPWILETPLIPFGRGAAMPRDQQHLRPVEELAGPCPSLTANPMVHPDGTITGCASVFAGERSALAFGRAPGDSLESALHRMGGDPLAAWIHQVGVVELKRLVECCSPLRLPGEAVNICHLCGELLGRPEVLAVIRQRLPALGGSSGRDRRIHARNGPIPRTANSPEPVEEASDACPADQP